MFTIKFICFVPFLYRWIEANRVYQNTAKLPAAAATCSHSQFTFYVLLILFIVTVFKRAYVTNIQAT